MKLKDNDYQASDVYFQAHKVKKRPSQDTQVQRFIKIISPTT